MPPVVHRIFFKILSDSEQYPICDDLWLCPVEYSACVSGCWGLRPRPPPELCPWAPLGINFRLKEPLFCPRPLSKFLATPCIGECRSCRSFASYEQKKSETYCLQLVAVLSKTCSKPGFKQFLSKVEVMEFGPNALLWINEVALRRVRLGMHDEIFHFELFKNFMNILKYFKTSSLKYFMKFLIFIIK